MDHTRPHTLGISCDPNCVSSNSVIEELKKRPTQDQLRDAFFAGYTQGRSRFTKGTLTVKQFQDIESDYQVWLDNTK